VVFYVNLLDVSSNITKVGGNFMDTGFHYFHLLKLKNILLVLCLSLICELGFSQVKMKVIDVPTRSGVTNRIIFLATPEPKATLILFVGGHGGLQIFQGGSAKSLEGNFLFRSRIEFASHGFNVAVIDSPSDRMKFPFLYGFRHSEEHSEDIKEIIKFLQLQAKKPVWLIGTSRGAESVMSVGLKLQGLEGMQGLVWTSTILARDEDEKTNIPVQLLPVNDLRLPVLIVHHELDICKYSLYSDLPKLRSKLNPKAFTEILSIKGGTTEGNPCEGLSHHGFKGVESEVILKIVNWITTQGK
jgi:hypothetical protein